MPDISSRGVLVPPSPIRKLVYYADQAKRKGITVHHLNIGQPDIATPKPMLDFFKNNNINIIGYTHSAGIEKLRRKFAQYYAQIGVDISYEDLYVTTGGSEGILFAMLTCLNPGEEIIIPEPFYCNYLSYAVVAGVDIVPVTAYLSNNFALPPVAEIKNKISAKTKAILICNPNNPTGYVYSKQELLEIKKIVQERNLFLIVDEAYRDFVYTTEPAFSCLRLKDIDDNLIVVDTVSKRYSACGARVGMLITKNKAVQDAVYKLCQMRLSAPYLEQLAVEEVLNLDSSFFELTKKEYQARRDGLLERLKKIPGVVCAYPHGAFYVIARLPVDDADRFCQWLLEVFSHNNETVMLAPLSGFYKTQNIGKDEVRFAYVIDQLAIHKAMDCLAVALPLYQKTMM